MLLCLNYIIISQDYFSRLPRNFNFNSYFRIFFFHFHKLENQEILRFAQNDNQLMCVMERRHIIIDC